LRGNDILAVTNSQVNRIKNKQHLDLMLSEKTFNHSVGGAQEDLNGNTRQMNNLGQTQDLVLQKNMLTVCLTV